MNLLKYFVLLDRRPSVLRKRKQVSPEEDSNVKPIEINTEATGIELHKDSKYLFKTSKSFHLNKQNYLFHRFYQSWQNFKDKNPYVNKVLDWKNKYEESDNAVIRASRLLTEKVVDIMGGLFQVSIRMSK